jgi:hypothetical protein
MCNPKAGAIAAGDGAYAHSSGLQAVYVQAIIIFYNFISNCSNI